MYWIYNIPAFALGLFIAFFLVGFAVLGVLLLRPVVRKRFANKDGWREHVVVTVEGSFVIVGILLALVTVGAYSDYTQSRDKVSAEAAGLADVYRSVDLYPEPLRGKLQADLKNYITFVIKNNWSDQQRGAIFSDEGYTARFQGELASFEPKTGGQSALHYATLIKTNDWLQSRNERLDQVVVGLPSQLWTVLILGSLVTIALTWLIPTETVGGHILLSSAFAFVISLLLFVTVLMDHPSQGPISVSPHAFEIVQEEVMKVPRSSQ